MKNTNASRFDLSLKYPKSIDKNYSTSKGNSFRRSVKVLPLKNQKQV